MNHAPKVPRMNARRRIDGLRRAAAAALFAAVTVHQGSAAAQENWARANLNGTLWVQTSEEYHALALSAYAQARKMLDLGLTLDAWSALADEAPAAGKKRPPAIILDVDETVLDNFAYQAWLVRENKSFEPVSWNRWVADEKATAVPGSVDFINYARERGVRVFYLTNRDFKGDVDENRNGKIEPGEKDKELKRYTVENLKQQGLLPAQGTNYHSDNCHPIRQQDLSQDRSVLMKGEKAYWGSEKTTRRDLLGECYRVILLLGDSLGDFIGYKKNGEYEDFYRAAKRADERREILTRYAHRWGETWIVLPNPTYGSWERALYEFKDGLPPEEKGRQKLEALKVWAY